MAEANLLVTFDPAHRSKAENEAAALLKSVGEEAEITESDGGTFLVLVKNAKAAVRKLSAAFREDPEQFQNTFRWVPVDRWCSSDMKEMLAVMKEFDSQMDPEKSWSMRLFKRSHEKSTTELIKELTDAINKPKVDLKKPDTIVSVEILGDKAAFSLLKSDEWLSTGKK